MNRMKIRSSSLLTMTRWREFRKAEVAPVLAGLARSWANESCCALWRTPFADAPRSVPLAEGGIRTSRAVCAFVCQIGVTISNTSALVTCETGTWPMCGKAYRSRLDLYSRSYFAARQPACFCSSTRTAASPKVGTP